MDRRWVGQASGGGRPREPYENRPQECIWTLNDLRRSAFETLHDSENEQVAHFGIEASIGGWMDCVVRGNRSVTIGLAWPAKAVEKHGIDANEIKPFIGRALTLINLFQFFPFLNRLVLQCDSCRVANSPVGVPQIVPHRSNGDPATNSSSCPVYDAPSDVRCNA